MNKPFMMLVLAIAVLVAALLGVAMILGTMDNAEVVDVGVKIGLILVVVLVAGLGIGMISKPRDGK